MTYQRPVDLINRRRALTGRDLQDALQSFSSRNVIATQVGANGLVVQRNTAGDILIEDRRPLPRMPAASSGVQSLQFLVRIVNPQPVPGAENQWVYDARRIASKDPTAAGYSQGGAAFLVSSPDITKAYNFSELDNDGVGVEQNGVDFNFANGTVTMQPATYGATGSRIVWAREFLIDNGVVEWWFDFPNPVTVTCAP